MDNFSEYIILLFIIFSIVQSVLSKKKKEQKNSGQEGTKQFPPPMPKNRSRESEVLENIFGLNLPKSPDYPKSSTDNIKTWDPTSEFKDIYNSRPKPKPLPDIDFDKSSSNKYVAEKRAEMAVTPLVIKESAVTQRIKSIRSSIKSPESLREYVLISEILNKPRALRK